MHKKQSNVGRVATRLLRDDSEEKGATVQRKDLRFPKLHKHAYLVSALVLGVLLSSWIVGATFFAHFSVGAQTIPRKNLKIELRDALNKQQADYRLTIKDDAGKLNSYSLSQMGLALDVDKSIQATKSQANSVSSTLLWWQKKPASVALNINEQQFSMFLTQHARVEIRPVKNALLAVNSDGSIQTTDESEGQEYAVVGGRNTVLSAVRALQQPSLSLTLQTVRPAITTGSIAKSKAKLEGMLKRSVQITLNQEQTTADAHTIGSWLVLTPNEKESSYDIAVDNGKVGEYLQKLTASNVHRPRDQVEITQANGAKTILVSGSNGTDVTNKDEVTSQIVAGLATENAVQVTMTVGDTPFKTVNVANGPKLLEVDTGSKRMYAYQNNVLIRTFLITAGAAATPTVTGQFAIYSKVRQQDMRGFNADGSQYFQPGVQYVNYFYRDYAVHGNYWRPSSYFGNVNSSHGCVGIANDDAAWIYSWASIGTPVVVHT